MPDNINLGPASADPLLGSLAILDSVEVGEGLSSFPNLVLGTGSGRCGTMSLAKTIAATHEPGHRPGKWKFKEFADFAKSGFTNVVVNDYIASMKSEVIDGNNIVDARCQLGDRLPQPRGHRTILAGAWRLAQRRNQA